MTLNYSTKSQFDFDLTLQADECNKEYKSTNIFN